MRFTVAAAIVYSVLCWGVGYFTTADTLRSLALQFLCLSRTRFFQVLCFGVPRPLMSGRRNALPGQQKAVRKEGKRTTICTRRQRDTTW